MIRRFSLLGHRYAYITLIYRVAGIRLAKPESNRFSLAEPRNGDDINIVILVFSDCWHILAGAKIGNQGRNGIAVANDKNDLAFMVLQYRGQNGLVV